MACIFVCLLALQYSDRFDGSLACWFCRLVFVLLNFSAERCAGSLVSGFEFSKHFWGCEAVEGSHFWCPQLLFGRLDGSVLDNCVDEVLIHRRGYLWLQRLLKF